MKTKCFILFCVDIVVFLILIVLHSGVAEREKSTIMVSNQITEITQSTGKKVALTFDDGPHPRYTQELLDGLRERNVKVTFFLIGKSAEKYPEIVKNIEKDGHLIGNHTYNHVQLNLLSKEEQCMEITKTNEVLYNITGKYPELIRPTFGEWDKSLECTMDMIPVLWSVDTLDWTTEDVNKIVRKGTKNIQDGDIILMHDYYKTSVEAALQIIDELQREGFEFVTVDDMIL